MNSESLEDDSGTIEKTLSAFKLCWVLGSSVDSATAPPRPPLESHSRAK